MRKPLVILLCLVGLLAGACSTGDSNEPAPAKPVADLVPGEAFITSRNATIAQQDITINGTLGYQDEATKYLLRKGGPRTEATVGEGDDAFQVISVPGFVFVKGPESFWQDYATDEQAAAIDNKWVVSNSQGPLEDFTQFTDVSRLFRGSGNLERGEDTTVDDQPVISLVDPPSNTDSTWWIAKENALLLKLQSADLTRLTLDYDEVNIVDVPEESDVTDFTLVLQGDDAVDPAAP